MFKTYDMPKDDRYRYFGEVLNNGHLQQVLYYLGCASLILISIVILILATLMMFEKSDSPMKKMGMPAFGLILFSIMFSLGVLSLYNLESDKQNVKKTINENTKHMRYITYDLKGKVNNIDDSDGSQTIRFDDGKDNYYFDIDNNVPISIGDEVTVKSNEKIPTSDDYNQNYLTDNSAKDTKITIIVNHNKKEQIIDCSFITCI